MENATKTMAGISSKAQDNQCQTPAKDETTTNEGGNSAGNNEASPNPPVSIAKF